MPEIFRYTLLTGNANRDTITPQSITRSSVSDQLSVRGHRVLNPKATAECQVSDALFCVGVLKPKDFQQSCTAFQIVQTRSPYIIQITVIVAKASRTATIHWFPYIIGILNCIGLISLASENVFSGQHTVVSTDTS